MLHNRDRSYPFPRRMFVLFRASKEIHQYRNYIVADANIPESEQGPLLTAHYVDEMICLRGSNMFMPRLIVALNRVMRVCLSKRKEKKVLLAIHSPPLQRQNSFMAKAS